MTTQSDSLPEPRLESDALAPATIPLSRKVYWALRREFWENRSLYIAPLSVAAVFLFGFLIGLGHMLKTIRGSSALDAMHRHTAIALPYDILGGLMMLIIMLVGALYCIDALYGERRDRSILFWKSLPVSDVMTVWVKASIPIVILPLLAFSVFVVTEVLMLLLTSMALAATGQNVAAFWNDLSVVRMSLLLLYHLLTVHSLWVAPIYGWLLLVSAWARRAPLLWAFVPPIALAYLERIAFNTNYATKVLLYLLGGNGMEAVMASGTFPMNPMTTHITPLLFLSSPGLLIGLAIAAIFLTAAARLRRYRGPI